MMKKYSIHKKISFQDLAKIKQTFARKLYFAVRRRNLMSIFQNKQYYLPSEPTTTLDLIVHLWMWSISCVLNDLWRRAYRAKTMANT